MTIAQAATELGISRDAVRKRIFRASMPADKIDGQWWIRIDEFYDAVGPDYQADTPVDVKFTVRDAPARDDASLDVRPVTSGGDVSYRAIGEELMLPAMREFAATVERLEREIARLEQENLQLRADDPTSTNIEDKRPWWKFW